MKCKECVNFQSERVLSSGQFRVSLWGMSSVAEIEVAIQKLPPMEQARLRDWLLKRPLPATGAKTGAELAASWPMRFHLTPNEADELGRDLEMDRRTQAAPKPLTWE